MRRLNLVIAVVKREGVLYVTLEPREVGSVNPVREVLRPSKPGGVGDVAFSFNLDSV